MSLSNCLSALLVCVSFALPSVSSGQTAPAAAATDIYHINFSKAVPGEAAALGKAISAPDPKTPMPDHFVVLRHQEGDDWDYVVIQHLGPKFALEAAGSAPGPAGPLRAWHSDTFVSGPSWPEFTKAMGLGDAAAAAAVYTVGVHRPVPGRRQELLTALGQPPSGTSKVPTGRVIFQHLEGADWVFLTITRHNTWQDFATDHSRVDEAGWVDARRHSAFHRDTLADRVHPK